MKKIRLGNVGVIAAVLACALLLILQNWFQDYTYKSYLKRVEEPVPPYFLYEVYSDAPERQSPEAGEFILKRAEADLIKYASADHEKMTFYIVQHRNDISASADSEILENLIYSGYVLRSSSSNEVASKVGECALYLSYNIYADPVLDLDTLSEVLSQFQTGVDLILESEQTF